MSVLVQLIDSLVNEVGFKFGDVWRPKDTSLCAVVPILREGVIEEPRYYLLSEVQDKVTILESGDIDELIIRLDETVDKPVFIRGGSMLKGKGTQSRVVRYSVVLIPGKKTRIGRVWQRVGVLEKKINVLCVAEVDPIVPRKHFEYSKSIVPVTVQYEVIKGEQGTLWSKIQLLSSEYNAKTFRLTDLVDELISKYRTINEVLKKMPVYDDQVGIAVLDFHGVVALELFDNPKSWSKLARDISKGYFEYFIKESELFELRKDIVYRKVKEFINDIRKCTEHKVYEDEGTTTCLLESDKIAGEYTTLDNEVIHLFVFRKERKEKIKPIRMREYRIPVVRTLHRLTTPRITPGVATYPILPVFSTIKLETKRNYKTESVIQALKEGPLTWKELMDKVKMAKATLSDRLRKLMSEGYITKILRDNGKEAYVLTAKGHELAKKLKKFEEEGFTVFY